MNIRKIDFVRYASALICALGAVAVIYVVFKYVIWALMPFIISWGVAFAVRPLSEYMHRKTGLSSKVLNFIFVSVALSLLSSVLFFIITRVIKEIRDFIAYLEENPYVISDILEKLELYVEGIREKIYFFGSYNSDTGVFTGIDEYIGAFIENGVSAIMSGVPKVISKLLLALPRLMIFILVSVIAAFYFSMDLKNINKRVLSIFPQKWQEKGKELKNTLFDTSFKYICAYFTIMVITFSLLLIGFLILRIKYALILSVICAVVDILPVLGVGSILIPWSLFEFARGNLFLGIGLLLLYLVITVIRQIIEPKIIGAKFGIHPLLTLFSMYLGLSFFGVGGMILGPVFAAVLKSVLKRKEEKSI